MHKLDFEKLIAYDSGKVGITVDVTISLSNLSENFQAKIDTGAEGCVFARSLVEKLGIEIETGELQRFSTVRSSFLTFGHTITLTVADMSFDSYVFFAEDENFNRNVLGRRGWLDRVIIAINDYDGKLYMSRYED